MRLGKALQDMGIGGNSKWAASYQTKAQKRVIWTKTIRKFTSATMRIVSPMSSSGRPRPLLLQPPPLPRHRLIAVTTGGCEKAAVEAVTKTEAGSCLLMPISSFKHAWSEPRQRWKRFCVLSMRVNVVPSSVSFYLDFLLLQISKISIKLTL